LTRVVAGELKGWEAAVLLGLSVRQVRRLKGALVRQGPTALAHANRGRASPRRVPAAVRQRVVGLYQTTYRGLNYQHFCELLAEREQLRLSVASVRRILRAAGLGSPHTRRPAPHRARRERMPAEGMLLQLDGSLAVLHQGQLLLHVPAPPDAPPLRTAARGKLPPAGQPIRLAPDPAPPRPRPPGAAPSHPWRRSYQTMRPAWRTPSWTA
jgi:transposase